ncbi:hypothetical protein HHK36_005716 [Tetracentron sinense]|uniref:GrpE protein homolog n=1 Tax=Tetracentron sinense TaxID=13715 RepID=A0A835DMJ5_TETSI|nr:hypothetical protein HHK36_005716 [Tetracentron sinense]
MSFSISPQPTEKETNQSSDEHGAFVKNNSTSTDDEPVKTSGDTKTEEQTEGTDSSSQSKPSTSQSVKRWSQELCKEFIRCCGQFGGASSVVKDSFSKIDLSKDTTGAVPLLKTLLEGVEMTDKQVAEVLRKSGVENFDPMNEQLDPHRHYAVFEIPDGSKPPGTVAGILKSGYMLYDRVIRPAEVGVTVALDNNEADQGSEA